MDYFKKWFSHKPTKDELYVRDIVEKFLKKPEIEVLIKPSIGEYYIVDIPNGVYIKLYNKQVQITNHDFFYKKDVDGEFLKTLIEKVQAHVNAKIEAVEKAVIANESDLLRYIYLKQ